ncbi:MAG TPA: Crp/Fnr family transcriptional regulator [Burkholderiales bacterium]|nr:Crp/Fnr family transcriptional regulator [Burkholderiales bacterium]
MRGADFYRVRLVLARSAHFGALAPAVLDRLAALARLRHARHGERLGAPGSRDDHLWVVVSGAVRISTRPKERGQESVHAVLGGGSYFGLANAVRHGPYSYDARAIGDTDLAVVEGSRLTAALNQHPRLWRRVSGLMARRLKVALDVTADNRVLPLPERLARRLIGVALSSELLEGAQPTLHMTQGDLAQMLDAGRSKINLVLKRLEAQGLLRTGYRTITLLDLAALRSLAGREVDPF